MPANGPKRYSRSNTDDEYWHWAGDFRSFLVAAAHIHEEVYFDLFRQEVTVKDSTETTKQHRSIGEFTGGSLVG